MRKALLLIDLQNDYFPGGLKELHGSEVAVSNAAKILHECRRCNIPVIHVQHISIRPDAGFFLPDSEGVKIHQSVKPLPTEKVVVKHFPNSFRETELLDCLKKSEVEQLIICGMMTHMCVDTTVRAAKDLGFDIILICDACATLDLHIQDYTIKSKDVQNAFLAALNSIFAKVINTEDYLKL